MTVVVMLLSVRVAHEVRLRVGDQSLTAVITADAVVL